MRFYEDGSVDLNASSGYYYLRQTDSAQKVALLRTAAELWRSLGHNVNTTEMSPFR